ncbi:hypothetical protein [Cupriavidus plantarum]|nr:hypothetical protein [Cupriavidus plantarum]
MTQERAKIRIFRRISQKAGPMQSARKQNQAKLRFAALHANVRGGDFST